MAQLLRTLFAVVAFTIVGGLVGWAIRDLPLLTKSVAAFIGLVVAIPLYLLFINWPRWKAIALLPPAIFQRQYPTIDERAVIRDLILGISAVLVVAISGALALYFKWTLVMGVGALCWWFGADRLEDGISAQLAAWRLKKANRQTQGEVASLQAKLKEPGISGEESEQNLLTVGAAAKALQSLVLVEAAVGRSIHTNSMWVSFGSLAGYACQASIRAVLRSKGIDEEGAFIQVTSKDGKRYFLGDALNAPLVESEASVWRFICIAAEACGMQDKPDVGKYFEDCVGNLGTPEFGKVRVSDERAEPFWTVTESVAATWPRAELILREMIHDPREWPIAFGMAIRWSMEEWKDRLNIHETVSILMTSAVAGSKIDLQTA